MHFSVRFQNRQLARCEKLSKLIRKTLKSISVKVCSILADK